MIVINPKTNDILKDPVNLEQLPVPDLLRLRLIEKDIIFIMPSFIKSNRDKRIYKVGFLNEFFLKLYPNFTKKNIFEFVTTNYQIFIELRQYQQDCKTWKENKYTKFIRECI